MKKIELPETQIQEVLYELINRLTVDRKAMMLSCGVWNLPAVILKLRKKGCSIISNEITGTNKYHRAVSFVHYSLENKKDAVVIYNDLKAKQRPKVCSNPFFNFKTCEVKLKVGCLACEWFENR